VWLDRYPLVLCTVVEVRMCRSEYRVLLLLYYWEESNYSI
jgi:hypothetical protein